jgi:hypothetical protein
VHFLSTKEYERLEISLPATVDIDAFLYGLRERFDFRVEIRIKQEVRPIRLMGKVAENITVDILGVDKQRYAERLELEIDDFVEASGYLG